jgi:SAM-dependent methyltransferase
MSAEKPDYARFWDEQIQRISEQKQKVCNNEKNFWDNPANVERYVRRLHDGDRGRIEYQLSVMNIPAGSSVLDIGAGPGTLAVPLALSGCPVTVVEPSGHMLTAMEKYRALTGAPLIREIQKGWEEVTPEEAGTQDYVIASLSLMMGNIQDCLLKMDAAAKRAVHLFWFLVPPSFSRGNSDLWPVLHGEPYYYEPTADTLWNILFQLGIHANLTVETKKTSQVYRNQDELKEDYYTRLHAESDEHKEIVDRYLAERFVRTDKGYLAPGKSRTAHIWWEKESRD